MFERERLRMPYFYSREQGEGITRKREEGIVVSKCRHSDHSSEVYTPIPVRLFSIDILHSSWSVVCFGECGSSGEAP